MAKRDLISEHCRDALNEIPKPFAYLVVDLMEANEEEWLDRKPETIGAENVRETGLTSNQEVWVDEIVDELETGTEHKPDG